MSSDIKERLRVADVGEAFIGQHGVECVQTELGLEAADRIEALECEVAAAELRGERAYEYGKKRQAELIAALDAAEARAERLRVALSDALSWISGCVVSGQYPRWVAAARKALKDDKPIRAAAGEEGK
jgi:hypothetical protein